MSRVRADRPPMYRVVLPDRGERSWVDLDRLGVRLSWFEGIFTRDVAETIAEELLRIDSNLKVGMENVRDKV